MDGIIFDLDNTLIESRIEYARLRSEAISVLLKCGTDPSVIDAKATAHVNILRAREHLLVERGSEAAKRLDRAISETLSRMELAHVDEVRAIDGAAEVLDQLTLDGYAASVLTRGSREYARRALHVAGLDGRIGRLVCRDDYPLTEAKPNPLALERAAALIDREPRSCILVGDHIIDLECAVGAGARFAGVLTGTTTREQFRAADCVWVIDSVVGLPSLLKREKGGA
jgi:phosphoglycolate phosphatase-like HAD superfamily hydrolase